MEIVKNGVILINSNGALIRGRNSPPIDASHISCRRVFMYNLPYEYRTYTYDIVNGTIGKYNLLESPQREMIQKLMTSTTMFGISTELLIFYARGLIWVYDLKNNFQSYRPIIKDIPNQLQITLSATLVVMHQNTNVCYIQTIGYQAISTIRVMTFPVDSQIMQVIVNGSYIRILIRNGDYAYLKAMPVPTDYRAHVRRATYNWSDNLIFYAFQVCYIKDGKYYRARRIAQSSDDMPFTYKKYQ